mmetsp:Transcript_13042/g.20095  ORF Transcript_13042/g.20095 Transcript_13042/m.20095 type:complete len:116 (-) Transcript_13042:281-628(-)
MHHTYRQTLSSLLVWKQCHRRRAGSDVTPSRDERVLFAEKPTVRQSEPGPTPGGTFRAYLIREFTLLYNWPRASTSRIVRNVSQHEQADGQSYSHISSRNGAKPCSQQRLFQRYP